MRRHTQDQAAEAARLRLELLGRELEQAGLTPMEPLPEVVPRATSAQPRPLGQPTGELPAATVIAPAGRHLRATAGGGLSRLSRWLGEQVPETFRGRAGLGHGPIALVGALVLLALVVSIVGFVRAGGSSEAVAPGPPVDAATPLASTAPVAPGAAPGAARPPRPPPQVPPVR